MPDWTSYKVELGQLILKSKFERMIHVSAMITELLAEHAIRPIIVGGLGVEIYTMNGYTTNDIDFVMPKNEYFLQVMSELGFHKLGKDWIHNDLGLSVEVPSDVLAGDVEKIVEVTLESRKIYVIGIEDLIVDRLRAAVHWTSAVDAEWGFRLTKTHYEELDIDYMRLQVSEQTKEQLELEHWLTAAGQT